MTANPVNLLLRITLPRKIGSSTAGVGWAICVKRLAREMFNRGGKAPPECGPHHPQGLESHVLEHELRLAPAPRDPRAQMPTLYALLKPEANSLLKGSLPVSP